jgi:glycosyltransferase involved in cell wall biosynthesis
MAKILFVTHNFNLEGAPLFLFNLARGLKGMDHQVDILSPSDGPLKKFFLKEGLKTAVADFFDKPIDLDKKANEYDAIIVNTISGYKFLQKISDSAKKKVAWALHESERDVYFRLFSDLNWGLFKKVGRVVFSSLATREVYEDLNTSKNFSIINTVGDWQKIDKYIAGNKKRSAKKRCGFRPSDILVIAIGTICLRKGQLEFAQAAVEVLKKLKNSNLIFVMVGGGRGYEIEKSIEKIINLGGFQNQIIIVNETKNIFDYYLASDIFVCNSYIEAFPLSILEAMVFKLPIISTDVYGIPEQIDDGKDGLLIMAGDTKELEKKIIYLLENPGKAKELGENARKKIDEKFQFSEMIRKYNKLISEISNE